MLGSMEAKKCSGQFTCLHKQENKKARARSILVLTNNPSEVKVSMGNRTLDVQRKQIKTRSEVKPPQKKTAATVPSSGAHQQEGNCPLRCPEELSRSSHSHNCPCPESHQSASI